MTNATADKLSRLRGAYDFAREDLRAFEAERLKAAAAFDAHCEALGLGENDRAPLDDFAFDLADAEDEVWAAKARLERARMSLAQAEAEAAAAA